MTQLQTNQAVLPPINDPSVLAQVDRLADRYLNAGGLGMEIMSVVGNGAEGLLERLPGFVRNRLDGITRIALNRAFKAASGSRRMMRDRGDWFNRLASGVSGAAGGAGGFPGAMIEMPFTITLLLRAMLDIAAEHGLDPESDEVRKECLRIFAAAGPMASDDNADLGLLAARLSVTGHTLQSLISRVAPRLAVSMGQKLAAQAAPIFGAVVGASINYTFTSYYQELARVHFGIMRLSQETGLPKEALIEALRLAIERKTGRRRA
ncbi:EcsC family protein [Paracoccus fistulariae]|uniref:EcsC family protein n=1 Tax=Paracoccus fistulariae TaxID=658446 RepID=A0ABY7SFL4_9RHOB|nr:EcsC family protein [Paracoccus fistulariae]MDB6182761.1 EcsC family protein [Paracoccus fistulariae]WCR05680.1 EcsC family protein [Paracoccus fistulariae]